MSAMHDILKYVGAAIHASGAGKDKKASPSPASPAPAAPAPAPKRPVSQAPVQVAPPLQPPTLGQQSQQQQPQGPVTIPFRELYSLTKGDPAHMEAVLPGITDPSIALKLMKPGPDGRPVVQVDPALLTQLAAKAHGKVKQEAETLIPQPLGGLKPVSPEGAKIMNAAGIQPDELYPMQGDEAIDRNAQGSGMEQG